MGQETPGSAWVEELARALVPLEGFGRALLVVDLVDGRVAGATPSAAAMLGGEVPERLADLLDSGALARPDVRRLRQRYDAWRSSSGTTGTTDTTHGWNDSVVLHIAGRRETLNLEIGLERRPSLGAEAALVTVWRADDEAEPIDADHVEGLPDLWAIYDADLAMVAISPDIREHGIEPHELLGTSAWMFVHPEDIPRTMPRLIDVRDGRVHVARYPLRVRARHGRWLPVDIEARRLEGAGGPTVLLTTRYVNDQRRDIEPGRLTPRQLALVAGLFDGLRVNQLAERHGLAVKTVRNHLAGAYRALGVSGQVELLETHHRPDGTA